MLVTANTMTINLMTAHTMTAMMRGQMNTAASRLARTTGIGTARFRMSLMRAGIPPMSKDLPTSTSALTT